MKWCAVLVLCSIMMWGSVAHTTALAVPFIQMGRCSTFCAGIQLESVERIRGMHGAAAEASAPGAGSGADGERVVCGFRVRALTG